MSFNRLHLPSKTKIYWGKVRSVNLIVFLGDVIQQADDRIREEGLDDSQEGIGCDDSRGSFCYKCEMFSFS